MANPMDVLAPNNLGDTLGNRGVEELTANYGLGVDEAQAGNPLVQPRTSNNPDMAKDKLRTAKAREFGKTKQTVGF